MSLHLILGPMFSGKTTRLIQEYRKRTYIQESVSVINYAEDIRYDATQLSTHDKVMIPCIQTLHLRSILDKIESANTILINEGQFFDDLYDIVIELVENKHKNVFIFGLDGDFTRGLFGDIYRLIPLCDTLEKLSALCSQCRDGTLAIFSHRITGEQQQVSIGSDNYIPLCRKCYGQMTFQNNLNKKTDIDYVINHK
jgi:thymidine kinase